MHAVKRPPQERLRPVQPEAPGVLLQILHPPPPKSVHSSTQPAPTPGTQAARLGVRRHPGTQAARLGVRRHAPPALKVTRRPPGPYTRGCAGFD